MSHLSKAGETQRALEAADAIERSSCRLTGESIREGAAPEAAIRAFIQVGRFAQAVSIAESINKEEDRFKALSKVAELLVATGTQREALKITNRLSAEAFRIRFPSERLKAFAAVCAALVAVGNFEEVVNVLLPAMKQIHIGEHEERWFQMTISEVYCQLAEAAVRATVPNSKGFARLAIDMASALPQGWEKAVALAKASRALTIAGLHAEGRAAWLEAAKLGEIWVEGGRI